MFNKSGITTKTGASRRQILADVQNFYSMGAVIDDAAYVEEDGVKLVKAGTPVYGDYTDRSSAFVKASSSGDPLVSNANGILLHDVDVTNGNANGTILVSGVVNLDRLDATTAALITAEVKTALKGDITFVK